MAYGLEVRNDSGDIQIDGQYQNLVLLEKGTKYSGIPYNDSSADYLIVPFDFSQHPEALMAARGEDGKGIHQIFRDSSGFKVVHQKGTQVDYMIFVLADQRQSDDPYGLQVFNTDGKKVFDSGFEYLKITDVIELYAPGDGYDQVYSYADIPSGKNGLYVLHPPSLFVSEIVAAGGIRIGFATYVGCTDTGDLFVRNDTGVSESFVFFLVEDPE
jgi:hypothetical protein